MEDYDHDQTKQTSPSCVVQELQGYTTVKLVAARAQCPKMKGKKKKTLRMIPVHGKMTFSRCSNVSICQYRPLVVVVVVLVDQQQRQYPQRAPNIISTHKPDNRWFSTATAAVFRRSSTECSSFHQPRHTTSRTPGCSL